MATSDFQLDTPRSVADALSLPEGRKKAAREDTLDSLADGLNTLEEEAGFWISSSPRRQILEEVD